MLSVAYAPCSCRRNFTVSIGCVKDVAIAQEEPPRASCCHSGYFFSCETGIERWYFATGVSLEDGNILEGEEDNRDGMGGRWFVGKE